MNNGMRRISPGVYQNAQGQRVNTPNGQMPQAPRMQTGGPSMMRQPMNQSMQGQPPFPDGNNPMILKRPLAMTPGNGFQDIYNQDVRNQFAMQGDVNGQPQGAMGNMGKAQGNFDNYFPDAQMNNPYGMGQGVIQAAQGNMGYAQGMDGQMGMNPTLEAQNQWLSKMQGQGWAKGPLKVPNPKGIMSQPPKNPMQSSQRVSPGVYRDNNGNLVRR